MVCYRKMKCTPKSKRKLWGALIFDGLVLDTAKIILVDMHWNANADSPYSDIGCFMKQHYFSYLFF